MKNIIHTLFLVGLVFIGASNAQSKIEIKKAWLRPAAKDMNSALFFDIINNGNKPDSLIEAKSKISNDVMIHESYKKGNDMMGMRMVKFVAVPAHGLVKFKPGGFHVMVMEIKEDLKTGQTEDFTLIFRNAGKIKIRAVVRDTPEN